MLRVRRLGQELLLLQVLLGALVVRVELFGVGRVRGLVCAPVSLARVQHGRLQGQISASTAEGKGIVITFFCF